MEVSEKRIGFKRLYSQEYNDNYYSVKKSKKYNSDGADSDDIYKKMLKEETMKMRKVALNIKAVL